MAFWTETEKEDFREGILLSFRKCSIVIITRIQI